MGLKPPIAVLLAVLALPAAALGQGSLEGIKNQMNGLRAQGCVGGVTLLGTTSSAVRGAIGLAAGHPWRAAYDGAINRGKPLWQRRSQLRAQIDAIGNDPDKAGQRAAAEQEMAQIQAALQPIEMEAAQYDAWADQLCKDQ